MKILRYEETDSTVLRAKALIGGGEDPRRYGRAADGGHGDQRKELCFGGRGRVFDEIDFLREFSRFGRL